MGSYPRNTNPARGSGRRAQTRGSARAHAHTYAHVLCTQCRPQSDTVWGGGGGHNGRRRRHHGRCCCTGRTGKHHHAPVREEPHPPARHTVPRAAAPYKLCRTSRPALAFSSLPLSTSSRAYWNAACAHAPQSQSQHRWQSSATATGRVQRSAQPTRTQGQPPGTHHIPLPALVLRLGVPVAGFLQGPRSHARRGGGWARLQTTPRLDRHSRRTNTPWHSHERCAQL